jgi:molybdate transport repressor ModE-like protein
MQTRRAKNREESMTKRDSRQWRGRICVGCGDSTFLDPARVHLLEAIDEHGSITQAAKRMPLSYKFSWDTVAAMSHAAGRPLLLCSTGGKRGGGSKLTAYARRLIHAYHDLERECQVAVSAFERHTQTGAPKPRPAQVASIATSGDGKRERIASSRQG